MNTPWLNLAHWLDCTEVEGPGRRFALWVQGCHIRCPGCCNPHMLEFVPRHLVPAERVAEWILHAHRRWNLEGVTFLGGEPMLQAKGLALVAERSRRAGLSVMVFTGFTLEYLGGCSLPGVKQLLAVTDLLVDGPYLAHCPETKRHWVGSTNQRFHFLTDRYQPGLEYDPRFARGIELRIRSDGMATYNGWPGELISEVGPEP